MATTDIRDLGVKLKSMLANFERTAQKAVERHKDDLEDLQAAQMQKGQNAFGSPIGRLRNPAYAQRKKSRGGSAPIGVVDLKNTGKFQRAIVAKVTRGGVHLDSTDSKKEKLVKKYEGNGPLFGFNSESKEVLKRILLPTLQFQIKRDILSR